VVSSCEEQNVSANPDYGDNVAPDGNNPDGLVKHDVCPVVTTKVANDEAKEESDYAELDCATDASENWHYFRFAFRIGTKTTSNRNATAAKSAISMHRRGLCWKTVLCRFNSDSHVVFCLNLFCSLLCG